MTTTISSENSICTAICTVKPNGTFLRAHTKYGAERPTPTREDMLGDMVEGCFRKCSSATRKLRLRGPAVCNYRHTQNMDALGEVDLRTQASPRTRTQPCCRRMHVPRAPSSDSAQPAGPRLWVWEKRWTYLVPARAPGRWVDVRQWFDQWSRTWSVWMPAVPWSAMSLDAEMTGDRLGHSVSGDGRYAPPHHFVHTRRRRLHGGTLSNHHPRCHSQSDAHGSGNGGGKTCMHTRIQYVVTR